MQIEPGCAAKQGGTMLFGSPVIQTDTELTYDPQISLKIEEIEKDFLKKSVMVHNERRPEESELLISGLNIEELDKQYNYIIRELDHEEKQTSSFYHGIGIGGISLIVG